MTSREVGMTSCPDFFGSTNFDKTLQNQRTWLKNIVKTGKKNLKINEVALKKLEFSWAKLDI